MRIFALDFDGVVCDSATELARSGCLTGHRLWPDRFPQHASQSLISAFRTVRPILKTGYECIPILSLLLRGEPAHALLNGGLPLVKREIASCGLAAEALKCEFAATRDQWIKADFEEWLHAHDFYPGIPHAIRGCPNPLFIITTKQTRFAIALCEHAKLNLPQDRIFGLESGPKSAVLTTLQHEFPRQHLIFVEDRLDNLRNATVADEGRLHRFYATWGYGTELDREDAAKHRRIALLSRNQLPNLLTNSDFPLA